MQNYIVHGWLNGSDYDKRKPSDIHTVIKNAKDSSDAEHKADKIFKQKIGTCEVIEAVE